MKKNSITPEIHQKIQDFCAEPKGNLSELCKKIHIGRNSVKNYAISQGWTSKILKRPRWSVKELELLRQYSHYHYSTICKALKKAGFTRSNAAIVQEITKMRFKRSLNGMTIQQTGQCFGVDSKVIKRYISLGYLKSRKRGSYLNDSPNEPYYITDENIKNFIINNIQEIDIRKVDKYWFVSMLTDPFIRDVKDKNSSEELKDEYEDDGLIDGKPYKQLI